MINIERIRALTAEAVARTEQEVHEQLVLEHTKTARENAKAQARATMIESQIPTTIEAEARKGRSHAIVMSLKYEECRYSNSRTQAFDLKGAAVLVFEFCKENNLAPTIESWHDGVGINSGFNIVAHW